MGLLKELIIPNDLFQDLDFKSSEFGFIIWLIYKSDFKFSVKDLLVSVL